MKTNNAFTFPLSRFPFPIGSDKCIFSWIKERVKIDLTRNVEDNFDNCTIVIFWQRYLYKGSFKYSVAITQTIWHLLSRNIYCFPSISFCQNRQNTIDNFSHWIKTQLSKVKSVVSCLPEVKYLGFKFEVTFFFYGKWVASPSGF